MSGRLDTRSDDAKWGGLPNAEPPADCVIPAAWSGAEAAALSDGAGGGAMKPRWKERLIYLGIAAFFLWVGTTTFQEQDPGPILNGLGQQRDRWHGNGDDGEALGLDDVLSRYLALVPNRIKGVMLGVVGIPFLLAFVWLPEVQKSEEVAAPAGTDVDAG